MSEAAGATLWWIGDWLAYGDKSFTTDRAGSGRAAYGLHVEVARITGYAEQTLHNAKCVCVALPISRRREGLTFAHAAEIVGRADPKDHEEWIDRVVTEGMSVKALREMLRAEKATVATESGDTRATSFLETTRQYVRDYLAAAGRSFTPAYRAELKKILGPVIKDVG